MLKRLVLCAVIFLMSGYQSNAQSCVSNSRNPWEWPGHNNWFFATNQFSGNILNFTTGVFTPAGDAWNPLQAYEGVSCASDDQGNLIYLTNGRQVLDPAINEVYGGLLEGNEGGGTLNRGSASQGVISVRHPLMPDDYYIFTVDDALSGTAGLNYAVVSGAGTLKSGVTRLGAMRTTEGISATFHANGVDVWIAVQESGSTNIYAYLLTCSGIDLVNSPVISAVAPNCSGGEERGGVSFSWDSKKFASCHPAGWPDFKVNLYDFDNKTGVFSNQVASSPGNIAGYDVTFSPDNSRILFTDMNGVVYSVDANSANAAAIDASLQTVAAAGTGHSAIEIGGDGNLYRSSLGAPNLTRFAGNMNDGSNLSATTNIITGTSRGLPTLYIPPAEEPDIQEVGPFLECDAQIDLHTYWLCSGLSAEDTLFERNDYAGTGIVNSDRGHFNPATAGPGLHEIIFTYCDVNDTIWIQVNPCNSCDAEVKNVTPAICPVNTVLLDTMVLQNNGVGTWTIDSFPTGAGVNAVITATTDTLFDASNPNTKPGTYKLKFTVINAPDTCYDTLYVVVHPNPVVDLGNDTTVCPGESVTFDAGVFTSYLWSEQGTGTAQTTTGSTVGDYVVKVTDANACVDSDTVVLSIFTKPIVDLGNDTTICPGESVTFDAGVFTSYIWSDQGTGIAQTTPGSIAGNYIVEVTDANNCKDTDTVALAIHIKPIVNLGNDTTICPGDSINFDAGAFASYIWSDQGRGIAQKSPAENAGNYIVEVTDVNNCKDTDTVVLAIHIKPDVNLGNDQTVCPGDSFTFDAGVFTSYVWSDKGNGTAQTFTGKVTGDYIVEVTDANACKDTDTVALNYYAGSEVDLGNDTTVCPGESVTFDAGAFTSYSWYNNATGVAQTYASSVAGNFSVAVVDPNGCTDSDTVVLSIFVKPIVNLGNDTSVCPGQSVTFDAGVFTSYAWSDQGTGVAQTTPGSNAGNYIVEVTDANNCKDTDTVVLSIFIKPIVNLGNDTSICPGESVTFDAGVFTSYAWSDQGTGIAQTTPGSNAGNYIVEVTDANNCKDTDTVALAIYNKPIVNLGNDTTICPGESVTFDAGVFTSYVWSDQGSGIAQTTPGSIAGNYIVVVTDANNCKDSDTVALALFAKPIVNLGNDRSICPGAAQETFDAGPFASYAWSGNASGVAQTFANASAGEFIVEVTDINNCKDTDSVQLSVFVKPVVNLGPDRTICANAANEVFDAGVFTSYIWSIDANGTAQTYSTNVAGDFMVEVTDANNCKDTDTVALVVIPLPTPNVIADVTICPGMNQTFEVNTFDNGNGAFTYLWQDGTTTASSINVGTAGWYWVDITDSYGCVGRDSAELSIKANLDVNIFSAPEIQLCAGEDTILRTNYNAADGYNFSWTGMVVSNNETVTTIQTSGKYNVYVDNGQGCDGSAEIDVIINPLPVPVPYDTNYCESASVNIGLGMGSAYSYSWSNTETTEFISVNSGNLASPYTVTVTNKATTCIATAVINVTEYQNPIVNVVDRTECEGVPIVLLSTNAHPNSSYLWTGGSTSASFAVPSDGVYTLTVTSDKGCVGSDDATVVFIPTPIVDLGPDTVTICEGENHTFDAANENLSVSWNTGESTSEVTGTQTFLYTVTVSDNGCTATDEAQLMVVALPTSELDQSIADQTYCFPDLERGVALEANPSVIYDYVWSTGETTNAINAETEGLYTVTISAGNCSVTDEILLDEYCPFTIFVPNTITPNGDGLNDFFNAKADNLVDYKMYVFDRWGMQIFETNSIDEPWDGKYMGNVVQIDTYVWKIYYTVEDEGGALLKKQMVGIVNVLR